MAKDSLGKQLYCLIFGTALGVSAATYAKSYYRSHDPIWDGIADDLSRLATHAGDEALRRDLSDRLPSLKEKEGGS